MIEYNEIMELKFYKHLQEEGDFVFSADRVMGSSTIALRLGLTGGLLELPDGSIVPPELSIVLRGTVGGATEGVRRVRACIRGASGKGVVPERTRTP